MIRLPVRLLAAVAVLAVLVVGCASTDGWSGEHAPPTAVGTLGPGFVDRAAPPTPEATITPSRGSWDGVRPAPGYRVVLLTAGDDPATTTLATAVTEWAKQEQVSLRTIKSSTPARFTDDIDRAITMAPDLVISAGNDLVDPLTVVTANHLQQQFLVVGAELAEPTANVTAVNWAGASFRGKGLGTSTGYDPSTFTPARAAAAVRAGVAGILNGLTGIVISLS